MTVNIDVLLDPFIKMCYGWGDGGWWGHLISQRLGELTSCALSHWTQKF